MQIEAIADSAVNAVFAGGTLEQRNRLVTALSHALSELAPPWLMGQSPAYQSLQVYYDFMLTDHLAVIRCLRGLASELSVRQRSGKKVTLPVWYGAHDCNDLELVSDKTGLTVDAIVRHHSATEYHVFAIGFAPGFAYLGELNPELAVPRLSTPRLKVPAGAVAIAEKQTAIYPNQSPGGWHLLGRCPLSLFNPDASEPVPYQVGDTVRFVAINEAEYHRLKEINGDKQ